jgi:hypothetical protein
MPRKNGEEIAVFLPNGAPFYRLKVESGAHDNYVFVFRIREASGYSLRTEVNSRRQPFQARHRKTPKWSGISG